MYNDIVNISKRQIFDGISLANVTSKSSRSKCKMTFNQSPDKNTENHFETFALRKKRRQIMHLNIFPVCLSARIDHSKENITFSMWMTNCVTKKIIIYSGNSKFSSYKRKNFQTYLSA